MTLTFVDANVLIAATRGNQDVSAAAFRILEDPDRTFASSNLLRLETLAKAVYNGRADESEYYQRFFRNVSVWIPVTEDLVAAANHECETAGVNAMDALHLAAANRAGAAEFVTAEKKGKSIFRSKLLPVWTIRP